MAKCASCGVEITHVRDDYTGATFAVNADAARVRGFVLRPPQEGERNPRARYEEVALHEPHAPTCEAAEQQEIEPD